MAEDDPSDGCRDEQDKDDEDNSADSIHGCTGFPSLAWWVVKGPEKRLGRDGGPNVSLMCEGSTLDRMPGMLSFVVMSCESEMRRVVPGACEADVGGLVLTT